VEFLIWRGDRGNEFCVIKEPEISNSWELTRGIPRVATMPSPARCTMDPSFRKEVRLSDNLYGATVPVISLRTRDVLEAAVSDRVEFLPVEVVNHKGRVEPATYFILHPLDVVDCIDKEASGVEWNSIAPDRISRCKSLVLKKDAIPENAKLFRPKYWGKNIFVRQDLADALQGAGLTGLYFRPAEGYKGIG
jgi:hypothetical protein